MWCTKGYVPTEQAVWAQMPDIIKDHAFLMLTHADQIAAAGEAALEPALLAELTEDMTVDNFEGMTVTEVNGETRLFLISDDNFNEAQRTLLLSFAIEPRD